MMYLEKKEERYQVFCLQLFNDIRAPTQIYLVLIERKGEISSCYSVILITKAKISSCYLSIDPLVFL